MSIPSEVEAAAWTAKHALYLVGALIVIAVLGLVFFYVVIAPQNAKNAAATAAGQRAVQNSGAVSAHEAIDILDKNSAGVEVTHARTRSNHVTIIHAPGAATDVSDAVDAAGRLAVCMRKSAADLPSCQPLLQAHP